MEESRTLKNGRMYLQHKRTLMLGISPGNPFFHKLENLQKILQFARNNSNQKILLFLPDKISEHNYRAVGGTNPEKSARVKANGLRNKCQEALQKCGIPDTFVQYVKWTRDVESSASYIDSLKYVKRLYQENDEFYTDIHDTTQLALECFKNGRGKSMSAESRESIEIDLEEGAMYPLKELAFFSVVADIYETCEEFVFVYHRRWPVFDGKYDGVSRSCLGFYVLQ